VKSEIEFPVVDKRIFTVSAYVQGNLFNQNVKIFPVRGIICGLINHWSFDSEPPVFQVQNATVVPPLTGALAIVPPLKPGIGVVPTVCFSHPVPASGLCFVHPVGGNVVLSKPSSNI